MICLLALLCLFDINCLLLLYNDFCSRCLSSNSTRDLYTSFESKLADKTKTNPKIFGQYVSSQDHNRQGIRKLVTEEGEEITNINKLENSLNQQLVSVFTTEPDGPLPSSPECIVKSPMESITLLHTEVLRCLQKLNTKKSPGPDKLHSRLLKETAAIIAEPLRRIFPDIPYLQKAVSRLENSQHYTGFQES